MEVEHHQIERKLILEGPIFHFHDYGRKGIPSFFFGAKKHPLLLSAKEHKGQVVSTGVFLSANHLTKHFFGDKTKLSMYGLFA